MSRTIGEDPKRLDVEVSSEAVDTFTAWFPDCGGIVNVDDAIDALSGHEITDGEVYDLLHKLSSDEVEEFMPYYKMQLKDHVENMLEEASTLGFGTDDPINGGDCVDFLNEWIPRLRNALVN